MSNEKTSEIPLLLHELLRFAHDPVNFAQLRARILSLNLAEKSLDQRGKLQDWQSQIEAQVAIGGFNRFSLDQLLIQLAEMCEELTLALKQLDNAAPYPA